MDGRFQKLVMTPLMYGVLEIQGKAIVGKFTIRPHLYLQTLRELYIFLYEEGTSTRSTCHFSTSSPSYEMFQEKVEAFLDIDQQSWVLCTIPDAYLLSIIIIISLER